MNVPDYIWNKDKRKRTGLCKQCGNISDFICSKCRYNPEKKKDIAKRR